MRHAFVKLGWAAIAGLALAGCGNSTDSGGALTQMTIPADDGVYIKLTENYIGVVYQREGQRVMEDQGFKKPTLNPAEPMVIYQLDKCGDLRLPKPVGEVKFYEMASKTKECILPSPLETNIQFQ